MALLEALHELTTSRIGLVSLNLVAGSRIFALVYESAGYRFVFGTSHTKSQNGGNLMSATNRRLCASTRGLSRDVYDCRILRETVSHAGLFGLLVWTGGASW